jgi:hypothetical protein
MPTALGTPPTTPTARRQPVALCVLVGAAVAVGWVLWRHYALADVTRRIIRLAAIGDRFWAVTLVFALLFCVPYALALLLWGRGLARASAGATVALVIGLFVWGWDRVFQSYVWHSEPATSAISLRVYVWGSLLVTAVLVPLAWGVARRSGRAWLLGLLVGPIVAAALRELQLRWAWWADRATGLGHHAFWPLQAVVFVAPFVVAVLTCWAIEARGRRTPQMESSGSATPRRG